MSRLCRRRKLMVAIAFLAALTLVGRFGHVAAAGEGIFVPPPKDAGDTLDTTRDPDETGGLETVRTVNGDVITGKVVEIGGDGVLRLAGPQFSGEVTVLRASLDTVDLYWTLGESALDKIVLTNGDYFLGEVTSISPKAVVLESEVAGIIKVPRNMVTSITFALGEGVLVRSNFINDRLKPWKVRGGKWQVEDGKLVNSSSGSGDAVHTELDQKEAVTFVAKVASDRELRCGLVLFADTTHGQYGRNSVYAAVYNNEYHVGYSRNGRNNTVARRSPGRKIKEGTLRFAYDPETSKARIWLDSTDMGEIDIPHQRVKGRYVMFVSDYPCGASDLQVLRGIVPPHESIEGGEEETDIVEFTTKDQVSATDIALTDGKVVIKTAFGELKPAIEKLGQIVFRKKDRVVAPLGEGDVRVSTTGSRLTIRLKELTEKYLLGTSVWYGDVRIRRNAIKRIEFKLEK